MSSSNKERRNFLTYVSGAAGLLAGSQASLAQAAPAANASLPDYVRAPRHQTLKQSSFDRSGGNKDFFSIGRGQTLEIFKSDGPGVITHIWFTIGAQTSTHLKELVLRMYWDGATEPSVETPMGDFFGLNLGDYFIYQSAFLNCSSIKALNCYFAMPYRTSARITVTNEGPKSVNSFYSNIDYQTVPSLPEDAMYFHAQYRQSVPNRAQSVSGSTNIEGSDNYVFMEATGPGQLMGVTLGVVQNRPEWFGEGDEMITIDGSAKPVITGTGTEDYFCGAWNFGGVGGAIPFSHLYNGAPFIGLPERSGGRYCLYRWHADNPVAFQQSIKHTIEHGHANDRADCYYSVAYWYQTKPATQRIALPPVADRIAQIRIS